MCTQYGGSLPVYAGTRYQRGGGILSSIARFALLALKKVGMEAVKAAPSVVNAIISKKSSPRAALLQGLKTVGSNTLRGIVPQTKKWKRVARQKLIVIKKRHKTSKDIFN